MAIFMQLLCPLSVALIVCGLVAGPSSIQAEECTNGKFVYGVNGIMDELLTCSLANSFDLDLTPQGDQVKSTSKILVEQGLSNKTSILHARLSGMWTMKRPSFIQTGWRCGGQDITSTSIIELSGLSLEVVEKLDMPMYRSQHNLALHKPCKTFDLPLWMCRQSKPIYRTITTWVNRAYYNLTLTQSIDSNRPASIQLNSMFTCPETFRQKITYSPSSRYVLTRHMHQGASTAHRHQHQHHQQHHQQQQQQQLRSGRINRREAHSTTRHSPNEIADELPSLGHPSSFTTTQSGNMPASPPYHNSVKVIMERVSEVLDSSIRQCVSSIDSDLTLMQDYKSFTEQKYVLDQELEAGGEDDATFKQDELNNGIANECSNKLWIKSRIELANQMGSLGGGSTSAPIDSSYASSSGTPAGYSKRNLVGLNYPDDPNQLLNPHGYYHAVSQNSLGIDSDRMLDDNITP